MTEFDKEVISAVEAEIKETLTRIKKVRENKDYRELFNNIKMLEELTHIKQKYFSEDQTTIMDCLLEIMGYKITFSIEAATEIHKNDCYYSMSEDKNTIIFSEKGTGITIAIATKI